MITGIRRHPITFLRTNPCATLLFAQLLGVLIYPFLEGSAAGRALIAVFGLVVLGLALLAVRQTPTLTWVGVVLAVPAVVLLLAQMVTDDGTSRRTARRSRRRSTSTRRSRCSATCWPTTR